MKGLYHALVHDVPFDPNALFFMESSRKKDAIAMGSYTRKRKRRQSPSKQQEQVF